MTAQACGDGRWVRKRPVAHVTLEAWQIGHLQREASRKGKPLSAVLRDILDGALLPDGGNVLDGSNLKV